MKNKNHFSKILFFSLFFGIAGYAFIFCFFAFSGRVSAASAGASVSVGLEVVSSAPLEKPTYTVDTTQPETANFDGYYENADVVYLDIIDSGGTTTPFTISADSGGNWEFIRTLEAGDYTSRVRIRITGGQYSPYSDVVSFTVRALEKPTFTVDSSKEEKVVIEGSYDEGARAFIEITKISDESTKYYELNLDSSSQYRWKLEETLSGGDYYARVRVRNIYGQMSSYSDKIYFSIDSKPSHEDDEEEEEVPPEGEVTPTEPPEEDLFPPTPTTPPEENITPEPTPEQPESGKPIKSRIDSGKEIVKKIAVSIGMAYEGSEVKKIVDSIKNVISKEPVAVAVTSMAGMAAASVPFALQLDSFGTLFAAIRNGLGLAFLRRKRKQWGMVYDAANGKPIPGARVSVFNEDGRQLEIVVTDKYGTYAFLVSQGQYRLEAQKEGFKFTPNDKLASFYTDDYRGEFIDMKESDLIRVNIPMVKEKDFKEEKYRKYFSFLFQTIFYVGFILSIFAAITTLSILNITLFVMYAISGLVNESVLGKVKWGKTFMPNGKNASFTYIKVRNKVNGELISKVISDDTGRYYLILNPGRYILEAVAIDGSSWSDDINVLKRKVINKKIKLKKNKATVERKMIV